MTGQESRAPIRVGVIGLGRWGLRLVDVLRRHADVTICCNREDRAAQAAALSLVPKARMTFDVLTVLHDPAVDAVVIATPIATHAGLANLALRAGKHVFVEKPLAQDSETAARLVDYARSRDLALFVGHVFLYDGAIRRVDEIATSDGIMYAHLRWSKLGSFREELVWNLLVHDAAIAIKLFGNDASRVEVLEQRGLVTKCDILEVAVHFPGSRVFRSSIDRCSHHRTRNGTFVTGRGAVLHWDDRRLYELSKQASFHEIFASPEEPLVSEVRAFLDSTRAGAGRDSRGPLAVGAVRLAERVHECLIAPEAH